MERVGSTDACQAGSDDVGFCVVVPVPASTAAASSNDAPLDARASASRIASVAPACRLPSAMVTCATPPGAYAGLSAASVVARAWPGPSIATRCVAYSSAPSRTNATPSAASPTVSGTVNIALARPPPAGTVCSPIARAPSKSTNASPPAPASDALTRSFSPMR